MSQEKIAHQYKRRMAQGIAYGKKIPNAPKKNIPVVINSKLTIWTDDINKVEKIKERYKNK